MSRTREALSSVQVVSNWELRQTIVVVLMLLLVGYLAYGLFFTPALFMDDWTSVVERVVTDNAQWLDTSQRRPLLFSTFLLQYHLLGLNISAYYVSLWLLYIVMAVLLYAIIAKLPLPYPDLFGLITATLFLVYPTNYTHMWLIQFGIYCATTVSLLYGYLLLRFARGGSWLTFVLALVCLLLPLGVYEGQMGIAAAWAIVLFVLYYRQNSTVRGIGLLVPVVLMGIYAFWRTFGYQATGVTDKYLDQITSSPFELLSRLLLGYKITLGWGWTSGVSDFLPWVSSAKMAVLTLFGFVITLWFISWLILRARSGKNKDNSSNWTRDDRSASITPYLIAAVCGVLLIGAGYIPTITVFLPSLSGIGSRFNLFATIGGAVSIAAMLMIGSILISSNKAQAKYLFLVSTVPFIVVGILANATVQYHNKIAWQEQQGIWKELFVAAPNLEDDTFVLFILPGFENRTGFINWKRTPLSASWEASSGIRLLYDNVTLHADVYFPDIDEPIEPSLTKDGVLTYDTGILTPYSRVVAFTFDNRAGDLVQLKELPVEFVQDIEDPIELCAKCILGEGDSDPHFRDLIRE